MTIQDMLKSLEKLPDRSDLIKRRDFFAAMALAGMIVQPSEGLGRPSIKDWALELAANAYIYADVMEYERVKSE